MAVEKRKGSTRCQAQKAKQSTQQSPKARAAKAKRPSRQSGKRKATMNSPAMSATDRAKVSKRTTSHPEESITETALTLSDAVVASALSTIVPRTTRTVRSLMLKWEKPILKAVIPGSGGGVPTQASLATAKAEVLQFFALEAALGERSDVFQAFRLASGEEQLKLDWDAASGRVSRAKLDMKKSIDSWNECLAMTSGESNATCEIYVCGTKAVTIAALAALLCHEGLHNLARRTRRGNPYLSEDTEHVAMALLGDPQLVHVAN